MLNKVKSRSKYLLYSAIIIAAILVVILVGRLIVTEAIKTVFVNIASSRLDKKVEIDGKFIINYSLSPSVYISDLKIVNREGWSRSDFAKAGKVFIKLEILPLLKNKIYIDSFDIEDVEVNLEKNLAGNPNWKKIPETEKRGNSFNLPVDIAVNELIFTNISINYHNLKTKIEENIKINNVLLSLTKENNLKANLSGSYLDHPLEMKLTGGNYKEINDSEYYWPFEIYGNLLSNDIKANGKFKNLLNPGDTEIYLGLKSENLKMDPILEILGNFYSKSFKNYKGNLGSLSMEINGRGKGLKEIVNSTLGEVNLSNLKLLKLKNNKYQSFMNISIARVNLNKNENTEVIIEGKITDYPLRIVGSACKKSIFLADEKCSIDLKANYGNSHILIDGDIQKSKNDINANINTELIIPNIEEYEFIFDVPPNYSLPTSLKFKFSKTERDILIENLKLKIGQSDISGKFKKKYVSNHFEYNLAVTSNILNINEILEITPRRNDSYDKDYSLDIQILPKNLLYYEAYAKIDIKNLIFKELKLKNMLVESQISDNLEKKSTFKANTDITNFSGLLDLDFSSELPTVKIEIKSESIDIGKLVKDLRFAEYVDFKAEQLNLLIDFTGSTLDEILRHSSLIADVEKGIYKVEDFNTKKYFELIINKGHLDVIVDKPITLTMEGLINKHKINLKLQTNNMVRSKAKNNSGLIPVKIVADIDDAEISLEGFTSLPINRSKSKFTLSIHGTKLNNFNKLFDLNLPDKGPYKMECEINFTDEGYLLENLSLSYDDTEFKGKINIITSGVRPLFQLSLNSDLLDLDDLFINNKDNKQNQKKQMNDIRHSGESLSLPDLDNFDATMDLNLKKIMLNEEEIGSAEIHGNINNGKLEVNPATINILGGSATFNIKGEAVNDGLEIIISGFIDNYNYSLLAKQLHPESKASGTLDMTMNISTKGNTFQDLDDNLNGELEFNIKPHTLDAGIINLWAFSLINNLTPKWFSKKENKPKVNCLTGKLKARNGILRPDDLNFDTTNVRVKIVGNINITNDKINLVFKPIPKKPQLFGLGVPIRVFGKFDNYHIITDPYNIGWYIVRLGYSGLEFILNIFGKKFLPDDGSDICNKDIINKLYINNN